jgi:hypothetical protein
MSSETSTARVLPAWLYFAGVAGVTAAAIAIAMLLRPAFSNSVLEFTHLQATPPVVANSFYTVRVAPLFQTHCISCHGEKRQKADLRLDSYAYALRGGRHGAVTRAGQPKDSELMRRITLPTSDDRAMPPEGKTPLSPDDVTVIRLWIAAGASPTTLVSAIKGAPRMVREVVIPALDPAAAAKKRAASAAEVEKLSARYPGLLTYESRDSAGLELNASLRGADFGDADLKAFTPVAAQIVRADLSNTAVTDASAQALSAMTGLKILRLANTKTGDSLMAALAPLKALKSLTVTATAATPPALAPLRAHGVAVYGDGDAK